MKTIQPHLKASALATVAAANRLIVLLQESTQTVKDEAGWLTMAAGNVSRYVSILNEGIHAADPIKVDQGADLLTGMNRYILDVDLHRPDIQDQINMALDSIHAAAMPIIRSIDPFDPENLAEAKRALQS